MKHYFVIEFSQRPGALRNYLDKVLGKNDDITLFEYIKKNNRETGPCLVGIELQKKEDLVPLIKRMENMRMSYELLKGDSSVAKFMM